ncbi:ribokinase [Devosia honganensis]|uniref:Ribokinase n=1 Tax=Devosia honganensis TaxID=1610527 RepID=A0ABV7X6S7_9HYPH
MSRLASRRILVVGSLNADTSLVLARTLLLGETLAAESVHKGLGGKGANQAAAAAKSGGRVAMIGAVGADEPGRALLAHLRALGVDIEGVLVSPDHLTGEAAILSFPGGENSIVVHAGANHALTPDVLRTMAAAFDAADLLVVQCEIEADVVEEAIAMAVARGVPVLLDPAPAAAVRRSWLHDVAFLTPNLTELAALTGLSIDGRDAVADAARSLLRDGVKCVLAKRGAEGVLVVTPDAVQSISAPSVAAIDTTGAGDMFAGAFAAAWTEKRDLLAAVAFANAAAALSTQERGAARSFPDRAAVLRLSTLNQ